MAAFTYQQPTFHLDSLFLSSTNDANNTINNNISSSSDHHHHQEEEATAGIIVNSPPICCFSPDFPPLFDNNFYLHQGIDDLLPVVDDVKSCENINNNVGSCMSDYHKTKSSDSSISSVGSGDQVIDQEKSTKTPLMEKKKRKNRNGFSLNSANIDQSKDGNKRAKAKRQKKNSVDSSEVTEEMKCIKDDKNKKKNKKNEESKKIKEEPPTGFVHVRARRGQATDSHSLAERVRREKINEKLKMLQGLVPGCDKVSSKALMLDEIINYVQSLQIQVEMLSMKLASMNPIFYDFGADLDAFFCKSEQKPSNLASTLPQVGQQQQQPMSTPSTGFGDLTTTTTFSTANNIPILDTSIPFPLQHDQQQQQRINDFSQENGDQLWNVGYQRQRLINQLGATNLCFFQ